MGYEQLQALAESYEPQERESLLELAQQYRSRSEREVLELAALATDVSLDRVTNLPHEPDADPQFLEAFRLQYPNVSLESLRGSSEERLENLVNGAKGKYFEVLVRDRLNAGERVGEVELQPGQVASLAESPTQPGWDLRIENEDGTVDDPLQLKATESMAYVKTAFDKYPNIRVVVPSEVDDSAEDILGTDISNAQLEKVASAQLGELGEGVVEDLIGQGAELAADSIPFVSMVTTGVIEGHNLLVGRSTLQESLRRGAKRMGRAAVYGAIGAALDAASNSNIVATPVVMGMRIAQARISDRVSLGDLLELRTEEIRQLRPLSTGEYGTLPALEGRRVAAK